MHMSVDSNTLVRSFCMIEIKCSNLDSNPWVLHEFLVAPRWTLLEKYICNIDHVLCLLLMKVDPTNQRLNVICVLFADDLRCQ